MWGLDLFTLIVHICSWAALAAAVTGRALLAGGFLLVVIAVVAVGVM